MDKKDIYEHLAKIYLDASSATKRKKRGKSYPKKFQNLFFISIFFIVGLSIALLMSSKRSPPFNSEVALILSSDALKINFNFDPAKKEIYTLNLNNLDVSKYRTLAFSVKKVDLKDIISMRVEFTSAFKEKSVAYFKDIPHEWKEYRINFSDFKGISDWSDMIGLAFGIEEWNVNKKKGIVYIDNVRLLK